MRRTLAVVVLAVGLVSCGGSGGSDADDPLPLGVAFCNDLKSGYTPFQILNAYVKDGTYTAQSAAENAAQWARDECPEQLESNAQLRDYLEGWDIDPDQP